MSREQVDAHARSLGYHHIGGMATKQELAAEMRSLLSGQCYDILPYP